MFEGAVAEYCGAPYCVAVSSCTAALHLACAWCKVGLVGIPKFTYVGVAQSVINSGVGIQFTNQKWVGDYQLYPYDIWDSARWFTSGMYTEGEFRCVSFHASKTLGIEAGGAILLDDPKADAWLRSARHDGRTPAMDLKDDNIIQGWHYLMNPSTAAQGILKLYSLSKHNSPLPNDDYPDLSKMEIFK